MRTFALILVLCAGFCAASPAQNVLAPPAVQPYTWRNVAILGGGFVTATIFNRAAPGLRYIRTDMGGAYRWNASTSTYIPLQDDTSPSNASYWGTLSLASDAGDPSRVLLACGMYTASWADDAAILISETQGSLGSWTAVPLPGVKLGGNENGRSAGERLVIDGVHVYLGTSQNGLYMSGNGGYAWAPVAAWPAQLNAINFVLVDDRSSSSVVYVAAAVDSGALYSSSDNGTTWSAVTGQPTGLIPYRGALDRALGVIYFTYANGVGPNGMSAGAVWRFNTSTGAWLNVTPPADVSPLGGGFAGVAVDAQRPGVVMVTTMDRWWPTDGILRSVDAGATWQDLYPASIPHSDAPWVYWHRYPLVQGTGWDGDIAIDPFNSSIAVHTTGQGVWETHDLTAADDGSPTHWTFADWGLEQTVPLELVAPPAGNPVGAQLLSALGDIDGFVHTQLDAPSAFGMFSPAQGSNSGIDLAWLNQTVVVRSHAGKTAGSISFNGGYNYTMFASVPSGAGQTPIAITADGSVILWSGAWSADAGATWTPSMGLPQGAGLSTSSNVVTDRVNASRAYVAQGGTLYFSSDGGRSFAAGANGLPSASNYMRLAFDRSGHLWIPTGSGLWRSTDGGLTAVAVPGFSKVFSVGLGAAAPTGAYPAVFVHGQLQSGGTGLFRSDDEAATWTQVNSWAQQFGLAMFASGDPKVYGRVYVATNGRGIMWGDIAAATTGM